MEKATEHRIRLAGPWEQESEDGRIERIRVPCAWEQLRRDMPRPVVLRRRFHAPPEWNPATRVTLLIPQGSWDDVSLCELNSQLLSARQTDGRDLWFEITPFLQRSNLLRVVFSTGDDQPAAESRAAEFLGAILIFTESE